jgi:hypothetical protein
LAAPASPSPRSRHRGIFSEKTGPVFHADYDFVIGNLLDRVEWSREASFHLAAEALMADKALLLGINNYKKVNGLNGCAGDVENVRRLLIEQFQFRPENVKVLLDQNVVKKDVKKQMSWLLDDAQPGNRVVFHFSGHGSYTADLDGDEDDGQDELICLYDMDFNDPDTYLLDDELHAWTKKLPAGVELTVVLDSCHSGTGTRLMMAPAPNKPHQHVPMRVDVDSTAARAVSTPGSGVRGMDAAQSVSAALDPASPHLVRIRFIDPPPAIKAAIEKRKKKTQRDLVVADMNHVLLAACRSDQTAADALIGGAPNGAFTYYLCDAIRSGGIDLARRQLIGRIERSLNDGHFAQAPQLEGPAPDQPLFGGQRAATAPAATTTPSAPAASSSSLSPDRWHEFLELIPRLSPQAQIEALRLLQPGFTVTAPLMPEARAAIGQRCLVYVHGICRHVAGYSNDWWNALHPFTAAFGAGDLDGTRREVLWSDLVNEKALKPQAARAVDPAAVREADEQQQAKQEIVEALQDRADRHIVEAGPQTAPGEAPRALVADRALISIPGLNCIDDFTIYMVNDSVRAQVIERFTRIVRPLLAASAEVDIICHSWGTVVAYEGLRELADGGFTQGLVRNFITVGAALSLAPVKMRLRPANRDGRRPAMVRRWVNLNAHGDIVGGPLQNRPYQVDDDFPNVAAYQCGSLFGLVSPVCAHSSYFVAGNEAVNRDIFAMFINQA